MAKIYWYQKPDGKILDESEQSAWRIHRQYLDPRRGYKYLGWSDGKHISKFSLQNHTPKKKESGIHEDATKEQKKRLKEIVMLELEDAAKNQDPPKPKNVKELVGGYTGTIGSPVTKNIVDRIGQR